jgi:hypothetical protein
MATSCAHQRASFTIFCYLKLKIPARLLEIRPTLYIESIVSQWTVSLFPQLFPCKLHKSMNVAHEKSSRRKRKHNKHTSICSCSHIGLVGKVPARRLPLLLTSIYSYSTENILKLRTLSHTPSIHSRVLGQGGYVLRFHFLCFISPVETL